MEHDWKPTRLTSCSSYGWPRTKSNPFFEVHTYRSLPTVVLTGATRLRATCTCSHKRELMKRDWKPQVHTHDQDRSPKPSTKRTCTDQTLLWWVHAHSHTSSHNKAKMAKTNNNRLHKRHSIMSKQVAIDVNLHERDASYPHRVSMADKVAKNMRLFVPESPLDGVRLCVSIVVCSDGGGNRGLLGRRRRSAELEVEWHLESDDGTMITGKQREMVSKSVYRRLSSMVNSQHGEEVVTKDLCYEASNVIDSKAKAALCQL